jgi:hypothetical protein
MAMPSIGLEADMPASIGGSLSSDLNRKTRGMISLPRKECLLLRTVTGGGSAVAIFLKINKDFHQELKIGL